MMTAADLPREAVQAMRAGAPVVFPGPTEQPATAGGGGAAPGLPQHGNVRGTEPGIDQGVDCRFNHAAILINSKNSRIFRHSISP